MGQIERTGESSRPRHPLWGPAAFLETLKRAGSIKDTCEAYAEKGVTTYRALQQEVRAWRLKDPEYDRQVIDALEMAGVIVGKGGGRPRLDAGDDSWMERFCKALEKHNCHWEKARKESNAPYSLRSLHEKRTPGTTAFDKKFADMVAEVYFRVEADFEEQIVSSRHAEAFADIEQAKVTETKVRSALKVTEKLGGDRWKQQSSVNIKGQIDHRHQLEGRYVSRPERLASMWDDKRQFEKERLRLTSGDVVDAEIVEDKTESL